MVHSGDMTSRTIAAPELELKRSLSTSIRKRMARNKITISELAERMNTGRTSVRRVLDAQNTSITFRSVCRAADAVGLKVKLITEPMSPKELGGLANRLSKTQSGEEAAKLATKITEGFYAEA